MNLQLSATCFDFENHLQAERFYVFVYSYFIIIIIFYILTKSYCKGDFVFMTWQYTCTLLHSARR